MFEQQAAAKNQSLEADFPADLPRIQADRERVLQVLANLISNAIRLTPAGGSIRVGASAKESHVEFFVQDTGPGIAADELPRVFERFWQARRANRSGAGLGLAIVKGIVEAHRGRIRVESQLDVGTTFSFTIPVARVAVAAES
jgi:signal transduction histidine kinase